MSPSRTFSGLPQELQCHILAKLSYIDNTRLRAVCRRFRDLVGGQGFGTQLEKCGHFHESLSPLRLFWQNEGLEWIGYDDTIQGWKRLPSLRTLLPLRAITLLPGELLEQSFLISTSGGLLCAEVSRRDNVECIIVCNPLTQHKKVLPPLNFRGKPYVMQIVVDTSSKSYRVIVVGQRNPNVSSSEMKPEVYDSTTGLWEVRDYIPEPPATTKAILFHSGAVLNNIFFCLAHEGFGRKVLLAYNVRRGEWLNRWRCSLPRSFVEAGPASKNYQLFECKKRIVFFWERYNVSPDGAVQMINFCFATLKDFESGNDPEPEWSDDDFISHTVDIADIESYNERYGQTCSPCRSAPANIRRYAMVMTTRSGATRKCNVESDTEALQLLTAPPVPQDNGNLHISSNPLSFSFEPSFITAI